MFLDIGVGILFTFLVGSIFNIEPTSSLFSLGVMFALLPDIDMLLLLLPKDSRAVKVLGAHRGIIHRPFIYLVLAPLVFILLGNVIGTLFTLAVFWHLFHDTVVLGRGIMWGWPFSVRMYRFFPDKDGKITNKFLLSWIPGEETEEEKAYGSPHWVKDFYLTVNPISIIEYSTFIASLILLFFAIK